MSAAQTGRTPAAGATPPAAHKGSRQQKIGRVMSDKMQKTIIVAVESIKRHRIYKRTYKQTKRYKVHDEENSARMGDMVRIEETRPLSKEKRWRLVEILQRAAQTMPVGEVEAALQEEEAGEEGEEE
jgi:small subunit ribosomal protein S17